MKVEDIIDRDCVLIDVRSPGEYEDGTIPGAVNIPIFDDEERAVIGTLYKKVGNREAKKKGIEIVSSKLADMYDRVGREEVKGKDIVMFCSRGGMRSGSLVQLLKALGHNVYQLEGGYKAYRRYVIDNLEQLIAGKRVVVIHGNTGVGKTEILKKLAERGFPSVDLEEMANSRGSIFGTVGLGKPRRQKDFEALLLNRLREIEEDYIIVESESPRVGRIYLPRTLVDGMRKGMHILVECSQQTRVERIVKEYIKIQSCEALKEIEDSIRRLEGELGRKKAVELLGLLKEENFEEVVRILLEDHYDPKYYHSEKKYDYDLVLSSEDIEECVLHIAGYLKEKVN